MVENNVTFILTDNAGQVEFACPACDKINIDYDILLSQQESLYFGGVEITINCERCNKELIVYATDKDYRVKEKTI